MYTDVNGIPLSANVIGVRVIQAPVYEMQDRINNALNSLNVILLDIKPMSDNKVMLVYKKAEQLPLGCEQ